MKRFVAPDGIGLAWEEEGAGVPLLCLPGLTRDNRDFDDLAAALGGRHRLIRLTFRGRGASDRDPEFLNYNTGREAADAVAFLDHLGLDRVSVVAHDWGGVALTLGPRIERLVAIDTLPLLPGHRWPWIARAWRTPVVGELAMGFTGRTMLRRVGGLSAEHADQILRHFDHGTQRAILRLYRSARENVAALDEVTAPALVLWGERDRYLGPEWADRIAAALGGETRVERVTEAGHWPWLDRPEILQIVQDYLQLSGT